ncbi:bifunctional ADP-dependent NAD(P)H-hydrate dehydratase/NAD(P)H-hydrate epimerase [Ahniella affigens]|uniref:Bifunctional NAD(P)H-hydrate repair enzyme n=1 Tax=Ahniella affigens TaxID=2021234 RepID=A0A2P1PS45_9GAMM|nr:NAD(P)H-hydrate dehydratase [Ahniella affigens]AVP97673.1 bifunctional ADP-dependent NAD(P)H-hydrate dehydratase/NAD(P)H-hydrate epimerase [Ahniella affigens]
MLKAVDWIYREADVRALERAHASLQGGDLYPLMAAAARAAFGCLHVHWPMARRIVVVCGSGNNGGDGFALAVLLKADGRHVRVIATAAESQASEARRARQDWLSAGGEIELFDPDLPPPDADLIVDAIFGIGLNRAPEGVSGAAIQWINASSQPVLALDLPSGAMGDTGDCPGVTVTATRTLALIVAKPGHVLGAALNYVGRLQVDDLDVVVPPSTMRALQASDLAMWQQPRPRVSHKGDYGRALILAGAPGMHGAALLSAGAALRAAPGYVCLCSTDAAVAAALIRHPEVMSTSDHALTAEWLQRASAVLIGPGIGQGELGRERFESWWQDFRTTGRPAVVDADALNVLAQSPRSLSTSVILTPHPTEAARLLGGSTDSIQRDRLAAAHQLAARFGAIIILKGAGTVLAHPDGRAAVCLDGNPGMAVAGMGDVLSGLLVGLLAQTRDAWQCACTAVLVHARTGDWLLSTRGFRNVQPSAMIDHLGAIEVLK